MEVTYNKKNIILPDFLIVGAAKSGTTSLYRYLKAHPQIFMPDNKEPWFFSFMDNPVSFESPDPLNGIISDITEYEELFNTAGNHQVIGEASPSYLYTYQTSIQNIKEVYGENSENLKIIIILRNPADRAFSQYMHFKKNLQEPLDFWQAIDQQTIQQRLNSNWNIFYDYIGFGMYYRQVKAYLETFENVKIITFNNFKTNTDQVVKEVLDFLGADKTIMPENTSNKYNVSRAVRTDALAPVYRFLFLGGNKFKKSIAAMLPAPVRKKLEKLLRNILSKRKTLSTEKKKQLMTIFEDDYNKLIELINAHRQ